MGILNKKALDEKYRAVKPSECWWCELIDGECDQYLFYDEFQNRYRIGVKSTAAKHKWEFTNKELDRIRGEHPDFDFIFDLEYVYGD